MKLVKYLLGFSLGTLFVYLVGSIIGWDTNPGQWNWFWRFICVLFALFWGHIFGIAFKDIVLKSKSITTKGGR